MSSLGFYLQRHPCRKPYAASSVQPGKVAERAEQTKLTDKVCGVGKRFPSSPGLC